MPNIPKLSSPPPREERLDTAMSGLALLYLVLLFLGLPLHGKLMAVDVVVPVMLWQLWRKREMLLDLLLNETKWLVVAFAWMALALSTQLAQGSGTLYDFAVFGYMAVIYFFYRVTSLPSKKICAITGGVLLAICFLSWLATRLAPEMPFFAKMLYTDVHFQQLGPNKLVVRYQFLFDNPNLLGSVYPLPFLMLLPTLKTHLENVKTWRNAAKTALLCLIACLPLFATASKHLVMTFGLLAGSWTLLPLLPPKLLRTVATTATALLGLLCLTTVLFQTYPALQKAPWVDFTKRGNYSVHQEIYAKIITRSGLGGLLLGHSPAALQELYPQYADEKQIRDILEPYGFAEETTRFATFMDPHQEYLNFCAFFGAPALCFLLAFFLNLIRRSFQTKNYSAALFLLALLMAWCWDDLGTKRWLWAAAAILVKT